MTAMVALLNGINIGSKKRIKMADLKTLVEELGHTNVRTYVNSGNVVFETSRKSTITIANEMTDALTAKIGSSVPVVVRTEKELQETVNRNPFPGAVAEPTTLHVSFLDHEPSKELVQTLEEMERGPDDFRIIGQDVYLYLPNKTSGATMNLGKLDKAKGIVSTSRNWRTVTTLLDMCQQP